jgi:hypothetical protein
MTIKNNVGQLTQEEKDLLQKASFYMYTFGVGLIFLSNCTWDCSDSILAKAYLDRLNIPEKGREKRKFPVLLL